MQKVKENKENKMSKASNLASIASKWWAEKIRHGCKLDNGENLNSKDGAMAFMIAKINQHEARKRITTEQIDKFEKELCLIIEAALKTKNFVWIGVDYHPCAILVAACKATGIDEDISLFPWKTNMHILLDKGSVSVLYGYTATKYEELCTDSGI